MLLIAIIEGGKKMLLKLIMIESKKNADSFYSNAGRQKIVEFCYLFFLQLFHVKVFNIC